MNAEQDQELWQVETGGQVFDTTFAEMTGWIEQGSLLRIDRVRKGNLRWIEAGKVPSLMAVFNAKESGEPTPPPVITLTKLGPVTVPADAAANPRNFTPPPPPVENTCSVHADAPASFVCGTCTSLFCKACPNSYGGTVKICPMCGAMCEPVLKPDAERLATMKYATLVGGRFGFGDFGQALAYPFKFKASLILGGIMYMLFSVGGGSISFGGIFMMWGALASYLMANTLTFGILATTVENFSQGKIGLNFMPTFEDFSIWDDVVHPFFLSIGVYIVSFGPLIATGLIAFFLVVGSVNTEINGVRDDTVRSVQPGLPYAANAAKQSEEVRQLVNRAADNQKRRVEMFENGDTEGDEMAPADPRIIDEDRDFKEMNQLIQQQRKAELEAAVGKTPETKAKEQAAMIKQILGYGMLFVLLGGLGLLWGLFYFPAACAVAGYTRSFSATLNPSVGIDTIRRLGLDYFKILVMVIVIAAASGFVGMFFHGVFAVFDMPGVGNVPANAISSLFGFYFSIVFACILGFALYKAADRLKLPA